MGHFVQYMEEYDNCPVYDHTQVTYYPLGDEQFSRICWQNWKRQKSLSLNSL